MKKLLLYSRVQCHLCEELLNELEPLLEASGASVRVIDIEGDPSLVDRYGLRIPVLASEDGQELSLYPLQAARVREYLGLAESPAKLRL